MDARMDGWSAQELREHFGIPPEVEVLEPNREHVMGIGAQDAQVMRLPAQVAGIWYPWLEAGEAYALCRRGANAMRSRAYTFMFGEHEVRSTWSAPRW